MGTYSFCGTKYIANIGCAASMIEAKEISRTVTCIPVKDKKNKWEPHYSETFPIIKENVVIAIKVIKNKQVIEIAPPLKFQMGIYDNYKFNFPDDLPWKGSFLEKESYWEAHSIEMGLEIFNFVRNYIKDNE
jgi:hypothetical protein